MDDDFNTSGGMAVVDTLVRRLNEITGKPVPGQEREQRELARAGLAVLNELTGILGIALDPALDIHRTIDDATRAGSRPLWMPVQRPVKPETGRKPTASAKNWMSNSA